MNNSIIRASIYAILVLLLFCCRNTSSSSLHEKQLKYRLEIFDCQGINIDVQLFNTRQYRMECFDSIKQTKTPIEGSFQILKDSTVIFNNGTCTCAPLLYINDKKLAVQKSAKKKESQDGIQTELYRDQFSNFKALGNEPFWDFYINEQGQLLLKTLDESMLDIKFDLIGATVKKIEAMTLIKKQVNGIRLEISILNIPCTDTMKGESFSQQVEMRIKQEKEKGFLHYKGCGNIVEQRTKLTQEKAE